MGRMQVELDIPKLMKVAEDLKTLSKSIQDLCNTVNEDVLHENPEEPVKKEVPKISLEEVRGVLAEKSRAGYTAEVRGIIRKYGADRLSAVDPEHYAAILEEAEGLADE